MKLNTILISTFLFIFVVISILGFIGISESEKSLETSIGESSVILDTHILDKIDRTIHTRISEFELFSEDPRLHELLKRSNQEFDKIDDVQEFIDKIDEEWRAQSKENLNPFMEELINNELSQELRKKILFHEKEEGYRLFGEVFVTNKYGANVAQTGRTSDYRQDDEEWWQLGKEQGIHVQDAEYDESADVFSTDILIRVDDEEGNFLGVMKVVLNIEEVITILNDAKEDIPYKSANFLLTTKDGRLIYSTSEYGQFQDVTDAAFFTTKTENNYFILEEGGEHIEEEESELYTYISSQGHKSFKGLGWILFLELETEEILAPITALRYALLIPFIITLIIAVLSCIFLIFSITRPVTKFTNVLDEISKGNFRWNIEEEGKIDEIKTLAESLSRIMTSMKLAILRTKYKRDNPNLDDKNEKE